MNAARIVSVVATSLLLATSPALAADAGDSEAELARVELRAGHAAAAATHLSAALSSVADTDPAWSDPVIDFATRGALRGSLPAAGGGSLTLRGDLDR